MDSAFERRYTSRNQAHRQGGFEGIHSNPPLGVQKILYTCIYILSALPLESGPLVVSLLLIITVVQASLVAAM